MNQDMKTDSTKAKMGAYKRMAACLTIGGLVSCGGGGAQEGAVPGQGGNLRVVPKGRWIGEGASLGHVAIVVPADVGTGSVSANTLWVVSPDAGILHKLHFQGAMQSVGILSGSVFSAQAQEHTPVSTAQYVLQDAGGAQMVVQGLPHGVTLGLKHVNEMAAPASAEHAQGNWQANFEGGQVNWSVKNQSLTGTATTGCSYSGQLMPLSAMAVYRVQITETCAKGELRLDGIATVNSAADRLSVLATSDNDSVSAALFFAKQP